MTFFNKKEDVIDIKLTQFGKALLARGFFKPVYYRFFDDDILYNVEAAGLNESQNDSEERILKSTPKMKTQHLTYGVETKFDIETEKINSGKSKTFKKIVRTSDPSIEERILLYPLHEYTIESPSAPAFDVRSHGVDFEEGVTFLKLQDSGILKNVPQINVEPKYYIKEDRNVILEPNLIDEQTHIDLMSEEITFADNSKIIVDSKDFIIDFEEINSFYGLDNFELEIYEVVETDGKDDTLIRLENHEEISKYFHIKTDKDVEEVKHNNSRENNFHKRRES